MCLSDLQESCSNDPENEEAAETLRLAIAHTTKSWTAAKEDTGEYSDIWSKILNKERATEIYLQVRSSALGVFVMIAFQAADLTQAAAKTIFSHFQETWPESRNLRSGWLPDEDDGILKAVIVTLKQNSTWLTNFPSNRIMYPEWLKLGAMGFRKGIKVTLFHGRTILEGSFTLA